MIDEATLPKVFLKALARCSQGKGYLVGVKRATASQLSLLRGIVGVVLSWVKGWKLKD